MTATTATTCNRCGRALRSATSIAAGYGPTCKAKVAKATAEVAATSTYKPFQIAKAVEVIELVAIARVAGTLFTVIASNGHDRYLTDALRNTCTCPAGEHGRGCYHLAAAAILAAA